jgi:hypothetical protein
VIGYNLIYRHKETGAEIKAKRIAHWSYKVLIDGKEASMSKTELNKDYDPDKKNRGAALRQVKRRRVVNRLSKEYQAFINERTA